jgi:dTDP-4-amino-4,6-dideoxygalactose transaminase
VEARDRVFRRLIEQGIQASKVHLRNDLYTCFGVNDTALPGVDQFSSRCLSIPCGWWVADRDRTKIADSVCQALLSE